MDLQTEQARLIAQAMAADLNPEAADEYDRRQEQNLKAEKQSLIPETNNWITDLYKEFYELDLAFIRQATAEIPLLKKVSMTFPELADLTNEIIAHTQTLLEIYLRTAEHDSERLEHFKTI